MRHTHWPLRSVEYTIAEAVILILAILLAVLILTPPAV